MHDSPVFRARHIDLQSVIAKPADRRQGHKPALIPRPLPVPVLRAVREAAGERTTGPLLLNAHGRRLSPSSAAARPDPGGPRRALSLLQSP